MNFRNTKEFPQWVQDYNEFQEYEGNMNSWPKEYQEMAESMQEKAEKIALEWKNKPQNHPYSQEEIDTYMGARDDWWERYPVFCCNEGYRPDEWDFLYDSRQQRGFSRCGSFYEAKIGNWYFVLGFDHD
jgi:hypothetical protein